MKRAKRAYLFLLFSSFTYISQKKRDQSFRAHLMNHTDQNNKEKDTHGRKIKCIGNVYKKFLYIQQVLLANIETESFLANTFLQSVTDNLKI